MAQPDTGGQPAVKAKGLERIAMRRRLPAMWRLDLVPFLVLYMLAAIKIGMHAGRFQWWARKTRKPLEHAAGLEMGWKTHVSVTQASPQAQRFRLAEITWRPCRTGEP